MRIFVTGASGWIGSAVIPELIDAGYEITGLARSEQAAATVTGLGAHVVHGSLADLEILHAAAAAADGVVHLGYVHDFSRIPEAAATDRAAIDTFGDALADSGAPLLIASGTAGLATGRPATENDAPDPDAYPRNANAAAALALAERGVRPIVVRFAPTVHGAGDRGFIARIVEVAREQGTSGYVGEGTNRWAAVHRADAARLVRLAVDKAPAGAVLHATADTGVPTRDIAAAIGAGVGLPVRSVPAEQAYEHFGWIGPFFAMDFAASSELTQQQMGWQPTHAGLIEDLQAGHYFG